MTRDKNTMGSRIFTWCWIFIYSLAFPFVFLCSLFSYMVFDSPSITALQGYSVIALCMSVPVSMLVAIKLMVSACARKDYAKARWYFGLPIIVVALAVVLVEGGSYMSTISMAGRQSFFCLFPRGNFPGGFARKVCRMSLCGQSRSLAGGWV